MKNLKKSKNNTIQKNISKEINKLNKKLKFEFRLNPIKNFKINIKRKLTDKEKLICLDMFKDKFIIFFNNELNNEEYLYDKSKVNALQKTLKNVSYFVFIYKQITKQSLTICKYFNLKKDSTIIKKTTFFKLKKHFYDFCYVKNFDFKRLILKSTKPINPKRKYEPHLEKHIANFYFNYEYYSVKMKVTIQQIYMCLKNRNFKHYKYPNALETLDTKHLSINTVKRIIKSDPRWKEKEKTEVKLKHKLREKYKPVGYWQFDLKIIGRKESPINRPIIIANVKDEGSKVVFSKILDQGTLENVLVFLNEFKSFADFHRLAIIRIRTDNAMMFKNINFVRSDSYKFWLEINNIEMEHSYLGQPECNGSIERFHLTLDKEFLPMISKFKTIEEIKEYHTFYMEYYNFERYHLNVIYKWDKTIPLYLVPLDLAKELTKKLNPKLYYKREK